MYEKFKRLRICIFNRMGGWNVSNFINRIGMRKLFILILLTSCGSRKVENEKHSFKADSLSVSNERILSQNNRFNNIYSIKPFDASKPLIIDGKEYFNASIEFDNSIITNYEDVAKNNVTQTKKEIVKKSKKSDKKDNTILYIGLSFVAGILVLLFVKLPSLRGDN